MDDDKPRPWGVHTINDIVGSKNCSTQINGRWVRAVAYPYFGNRLIAAWWVLTGRAYAIQWPKSGDLEKALEQ